MVDTENNNLKKICHQKSDFKAKMHQIRVYTLPCEKNTTTG